MRVTVPRKVMSWLYYSLVYPYLVYCNGVWGGAYRTITDKLFRLQKKIIRIMFNANYLSHTTPLFFQSKILNVADIHEYLLALYVYKRKLRGDLGRADYAPGHRGIGARHRGIGTSHRGDAPVVYRLILSILSNDIIQWPFKG